MGITGPVANLYVLFHAKGLTRFKTKLNILNKNLGGLTAGLSKVGDVAKKSLMVAGGALAFATVEAAKFETQMANVRTMLTDVTDHYLKGFSKGIMDLGKEFGENSANLSKGLYDILSASIAPAKAMETLRQASIFAAGGLTDVATAVDAVTTVLNAYQISASRTTEVTDKFFQTVRRGKLCITGDSKVLLSDGRYVRIDSLKGENEVVSWDGRTFTPANSKFWDLGEKPVLELVTKTGRKITTTPEHPYLTTNGWVEASKLTENDKIAVPVSLPFFGNRKPPKEGWDTLLGWIISEGNTLSRSIRIGNNDDNVHNKLKNIVENSLGLNYVYLATGKLGCKSYSITAGKSGHNHNNPAIDQLRKWGLMNKGCDEKFIPHECFKWKKKHVIKLLKGLFDGDGWLCIVKKNRNSQFQLGYCSNSERLVRDISHLLLRFGIVGIVRKKGDAWVWETRKYIDIHRFVSFIGIDRPAAEKVIAYENSFDWDGRGCITSNLNTKKEYRRFPGCRDYKRPIFYDKIKSIKEKGKQHVYDLTVPVHENFVANDIIAHNTAEELAQNIGKLSSTAHIAGVSLDEMLAAVATMTRQGIKGRRAMTAMLGMLRSFLKPSEKAKKAAKEVGIELSTQTLRTKGLVGILKELQGIEAERLALMFPRIRGLKALSALVTDYAGFQKDVNLMVLSGGQSFKQYTKVQETATFQMKRLWRETQNLFKAMGKKLLPDIKSLVKWLLALMTALKNNADKIIPFIKRWATVAAKVLIVVGVVKTLIGTLKALGAAMTIFKLSNPILAGLALMPGLIMTVITAVKGAEVAYDKLTESVSGWIQEQQRGADIAKNRMGEIEEETNKTKMLANEYKKLLLQQDQRKLKPEDAERKAEIRPELMERFGKDYFQKWEKQAKEALPKGKEGILELKLKELKEAPVSYARALKNEIDQIEKQSENLTKYLQTLRKERKEILEQAIEKGFIEKGEGIKELEERALVGGASGAVGYSNKAKVMLDLINKYKEKGAAIKENIEIQGQEFEVLRKMAEEYRKQQKIEEEAATDMRRQKARKKEVEQITAVDESEQIAEYHKQKKALDREFRVSALEGREKEILQIKQKYKLLVEENTLLDVHAKILRTIETRRANLKWDAKDILDNLKKQKSELKDILSFTSGLVSQEDKRKQKRKELLALMKEHGFGKEGKKLFQLLDKRKSAKERAEGTGQFESISNLWKRLQSAAVKPQLSIEEINKKILGINTKIKNGIDKVNKNIDKMKARAG